jgi:O-antigen ligase
MPSQAAPRLASATVLLVAAACATAWALTASGALDVPGRLVVGLAAAAALGWAAIWQPFVALGLFAGIAVLLEDARTGYAIPNSPAFYGPNIGVPILRATDALLVALAAAVVIARRSSAEPVRVPRYLLWPGLLLTGGLAVGLVEGFATGADPENMLSQLRPFAYLLIVPLLVVNLPWRQIDLRKLIALASAVIAGKALIGIAVYVSGRNQVGVDSLSYYQPTANWILLLFCVAVLAGLLVRAPVPKVALVAALPALVCLLLSFRRSFWLGAVVAVAALFVAVLVTSGRHDRTRTGAAIAAVVATAACCVAALASGLVPSGLAAPISERVQSLSADRLVSDREDRYRLGEQRNVIATLARDPVFGVGLGAPWAAVHPLSLRFDKQRLYSHNALTSWWLKLGILGALAYLALLIAVAARGLRAARARAPGSLGRALMLAGAAGLIGLAVAETSASFTGVELRLTMLVAVLLGLLAIDPSRNDG